MVHANLMVTVIMLAVLDQQITLQHLELPSLLEEALSYVPTLRLLPALGAVKDIIQLQLLELLLVLASPVLTGC